MVMKAANLLKNNDLELFSQTAKKACFWRRFLGYAPDK
jgi:hypothetical protein